ncbi:hypothetical protein [Ekhidna sp.]|uniref:hypothetical protein n=1 Tax=Ekhidna sp. TaxID=2608089 RepID=UPI0032999E0D
MTELKNVALQHKELSDAQELKLKYLIKILNVIDTKKLEEEHILKINRWIDLVNSRTQLDLDSYLLKAIFEIKYLIESQLQSVLLRKKRIDLLKRSIWSVLTISLTLALIWIWEIIYMWLLVKPLCIILFVTCLEWTEKKPLKLFHIRNI